MKWGRFAEYLCGGLSRRVLTAPNHASAVLPLEGSSPSPCGSCLPGCAAEPEHGGGPCTGRGFSALAEGARPVAALHVGAGAWLAVARS